MKLIKMNAFDNDFLIFDQRDKYNLNINIDIENIKFLSYRKNIGCDQFIVINNNKDADIYMKIYNQDGSSSSACGNATSCIADLIMRESKRDKINIKTDHRIINCYKNKNNEIEINMGKAVFEKELIPMENIDIDKNNFFNLHIDNKNYRFTAANIGNPHIVNFDNYCEDISYFIEISKIINKMKYFPQGINISFAKIISQDKIIAKIYERGVGVTNACGTAACAIAITGYKNNLIKKNEFINISFNNDFVKSLKIKITDQEEIIMISEYNKICNIIIDNYDA